ncbi:beta-ketoacyl-ACP synthase [Gilvimarinus sp. DA14]|uniref:beta-ketoacyl-ACP synthase n=1 Tax=Gilvimarinus sp. DA14 TaxID=2956798 RepID=UPI0020B8111E|nr:beta-ketoacyl-ACP synthase [Gilvimarinus sp. DA14]UTF59735.1 beta-ketoacyl-ACP synthase [Gilvimarinus sp. DA14]
MKVYLTDMGLVNGLGSDRSAVAQALFAGERAFQPCDWVPDRSTFVSAVTAALPDLPPELAVFNSRNTRLACSALTQLNGGLEQARARYAPERIAVVAGTSTSGIAEGEVAVAAELRGAPLPPQYHYQAQEIGNLGQVVARLVGARGPAYTISTACSSSAHALASARRLLATGMADAVIAGGADSLCRLTVNGFAALESVSQGVCSPFSQNRDGINIGEAAAFFLVTREPLVQRIELLGVGASSDAHHISAPDPQGKGAEAAIRAALHQAELAPEAVDYINLHGTGTALNDAMEASVIDRLFPQRPLCSSSKGQLGHTLGAAGATEAALIWLALTGHGGKLPPHIFDGHYDPALPRLNLVPQDNHAAAGARVCLSNSFAFGGNNAAVIMHAGH